MDRFKLLLTLTLLACFATSAWAIDLNESFDGTTFPPVAWQSFETGQGVNLWHRGTINEHSGNGVAVVSEENLAGGDVAARWLISPQLHVNSGTDEISYWVRTLFSFVTDNDSLYVLLSTTDAQPASFTTTLAQYLCGSGGAFQNTYVNYTHNLATWVGQDIYIAFLHRDEGGGGNEVYLDDVTGPELLAPPNEATTPSPEDGALGVLNSTNLSWVNGIGTSTIDLYLALSQDSIDNNEVAARKLNNVAAVELYDPPANLQANSTYYWKVVTRNVYGATNSAVWTFTIVGGALSGSYDIGGGDNDYASFSEAVAALYSNGITSAVTFNVYGTDYEERLEFIGPITGAGSGSRVSFLDASGTARILDSSATTSSIPVILLSGASYITWDGIDIWASVETDIGVTLTGGASENIIKNATITSHLGTSVSHPVRMLSTGNNNNLFQNLDCVAGNSGLHMTSSADAGCTGNIIENCRISQVKFGVYVSHQANMIIRNNDIQLNWPGNTATSWGLDVGSSFGPNSSVSFYGNEVHNIVSTSSTGSGLARTESSGSAGSQVRIYNNFCYDFQVTGSGQCRGLYKQGSSDVDFYHNSVYINDVAATGQVAMVHLTSSTGTERIQNNIFVNGELTNVSDGVYGTLSTYVIEVLENNCYYNSSSSWQIYDIASAEYADLAALQAATSYEAFGLEGNPGFTSATDLHIQPSFSLVNNVGTSIAYVTEDIDGDTRSATPDLGADEYDAALPPNDYAVLELIGVLPLYAENTVTPIDVRVQNRGSAAQTDVPVRLFYDGVQAQELLVSLASEAVDTIHFSWTTPAAPSSGNLEVQSFLAGDADVSNDSVFSFVTIVEPPMSGDYDLGGGNNDFATFAEVVLDLTQRGVGGPVTINVFANTYNETVSIPAIVGASATNTITFVEAIPVLTPPEIVGASPTLQLNGADYVIFDNIDVTCTGTGRAVEITNDADFNTIKNCAVTASSVTGTSNYSVYLLGGGNDGNVFDNLIVSGGYYGIRLSGATGTSDVGNEIMNCSVIEGKYCIYLERQDGSSVHDCDLEPGYAGSTTEVYGVYAGAQNTGTMSFAYANRIHNFRTSTNSNGVYVTTSGNLVAYNNFIYDWQVTGGTVYGLRAAAGTSAFYNNSVLIGDVATTANIYGFYITGSSTNSTLINNILQLDVPTEECWSIYVSSGVLASDNNCVYGAGTGYNVGFSGGSSYPTVGAWSGATGLDGSSVQGIPGFLDATNLHILPTFSLCNGAGQTVALVTTDIDGETRGTPPDIGADEYEFSALAHDYGVYAMVNLPPSFVGGLPATIDADIQNFGTSAETNVPVRLYYNDVQQSEILVSLAAGARDTVTLSWTPPISDYEVGTLEVHAFLATDLYADNDSAATSVTIVGPPLSGTYDLGGGNNDFATFTDAVSALENRGIDGEVVFEVYDGTYDEAITITEITGTNFADRVIFREHMSAAADVVILTNGAAARVIYLDGADFITFEGIDVVGTNAANTVVELDNGATYNSFLSCGIYGRDSTTTATRGIKLNFDGNDNCLIDGCTITGVFYAVRCEGGSGTVRDLEVSNCLITGASYCVYLDDSRQVRIHDNDLQPHGYASLSCYGVYIASGVDSAYVYSNKVHNFRHTSVTDFPDVAAVYCSGGTTFNAFVYNNFFYDYNTSGPSIYGVRNSSSITFVYNNSILINDVPDAGDAAGIYVGLGTLTALNNVVKVDLDTNTCYCIWRASGSLDMSDYNCLTGNGAAFFTARDGTTEYPTLVDWQLSGRDGTSISDDPHFVSDLDLHIDSLFATVDGLGTPLPLVTVDIDGDTRSGTPDIGADEYEPNIIPEPVTDLVIYVDYDLGDAILLWSPTLNAVAYEVYVGTEFGFPIEPGTSLGTTTGTTFTDVGAIAASPMRFYVVVALSQLP